MKLSDSMKQYNHLMALQEVEVSTILLISLKFYILKLTGVI